MWLNRFKIALIEKNIPELAELLDAMPPFESVAEMEEAAALCKEAEQLLQRLKEETLRVKSQLRKNIEFLRATHSDATAGLDITS